MKTKSTIAAALLFGLLPVAPASAQVTADEQEFQAMAATLASNDAERQSAIDTCIEQGIGQSPDGLAEFMGVPIEQATETWCTRMHHSLLQAV